MNIDPPYNTGNENWIYNDNVNDPKIKKWLGEVVGKEGEDLSRHDKWLCMMYPRLRLLHKLLAKDGAIFISIDDVEVSNLRLICNEIFGDNNFMSDLIWQHSLQSNGYGGKFVSQYNHTLVYCKSNDFILRNLPRNDENNKLYNIDFADSYPGLDDEAKTILRVILKSDMPRSVSKMREETGLSDYKVRKWLDILDEKKLVQRIGSGPTTKYAIRETADEKITQLQIALDNLKTKE